MIMTGASVAWVVICVPDGLEARERVRKDPNLFMCCDECVQGRVNGYQFCPHYGAGLNCSTGIDVYGGAGKDMDHGCP